MDFSAVRGLPVVGDGKVYAISVGGLASAIDLPSGRRLWEREVAGEDSPWAAGSWLFIISLEQKMAALTRDDGRVAWVTDLPRWKDTEKQKDPITWFGPLLAGDRLVVAGTNNQALAVSPYTGDNSWPAGTVRSGIARTYCCGRHRVRGDGRRQAAGAALTGMLPLVVIAGRPNVGKSTLFNRLAGKRLALVSDTPGVTRDRKEAEALLRGRLVRLVDTAGLEEAAPETLAGRMREGAGVATAAADVVVFVVDARTGVTPADRHFAQWLRRQGRSVLLVANKAEGRSARSSVLDAFELGFGEPVAVSAEHGEGISELMSEIADRLPTPGKYRRTFRRRAYGR